MSGCEEKQRSIEQPRRFKSIKTLHHILDSDKERYFSPYIKIDRFFQYVALKIGFHFQNNQRQWSFWPSSNTYIIMSLYSLSKKRRVPHAWFCACHPPFWWTDRQLYRFDEYRFLLRFRRRNCQLSWFRPGFGNGRNSHFGFGYGRNSRFIFGIVTASRNSYIEFGKHGITLQPFPNAVSACPYTKLASSGSGVA